MHSGCKYGHLTVLSSEMKPSEGGLYLNTLCDCGNLSQKRAKYVTAGRIKTCGKCQLGRRLMSTRGKPRLGGEKATQALYNSAVARGTTAGLPFEDYILRIKENCACCGSAPRQKTPKLKLLFNFVVIGKLAQVDTEGSVMVVCGICRRRIGVQNPWEFLDYLIKCALHLQTLIAK